MPEPAIGQISPETVVNADEVELRSMLDALLTRYGLTLESALSPEGLAELSGTKNNVWSGGDSLRIAVLYLDGKSNDEIAQAIDRSRERRKRGAPVEAHSIGGRIGAWFTENVKETRTKGKKGTASSLSQTIRDYRKWHALMEPTSASVAEDLRALKEKFGLGPAQIFHPPSAIVESRAKRSSARRAPAVSEYTGATYSDIETVVHLIRLLYVERYDRKRLAQYLSEQQGRTVRAADIPDLTRFLTENAMRTMGVSRMPEGGES